jgi:hypothetical protein
MGREIAALSLSLCAVEFGSALGEMEYVGLEEKIIGGGGFLVMLRALGMKLKGSMKTLEGLFDL